MARIRTIKPEFPQSESMGRVSREARLLFIQMWTLCDDAGRLRAASRMLASLLYPYDDDAPSHIDAWLDELEREKCIRRYVVEGATYAEITNWLEHQKIDKPSKSKIPEPRETSRGLANVREHSSLDQGREGTKEGKGEGYSEPIGSDAPSAPAVVPIDVRTSLFREGLEIVKAMTGKPEGAVRGLLGKWLKEAKDDAARVLALLRQARSDQRAELVSWMEASLRVPQDDERIYRGVI